MPDLCELGCLPIVVAKQPTEALLARDRPYGRTHFLTGIDQVIIETLMIPFVMIVCQKLVDRIAQRVLSKEDHAIQSALLDGAHKPLRVSIQIRRARRQLYCLDTFLLQEVAELRGEDRIAIHDQVSNAQQEPIDWIRSIAGDLLDPTRVRMLCDARKMHTPVRHLDEEEHIVPDQAKP